MKHEAILTSLLRWQNDQALLRRQEYTVFGLSADGKFSINPESFSECLKHPPTMGDFVIDREQSKAWLAAAEQVADKRLAEVSNLHLHPESKQWVAVGWVELPL